MRAAQSKFCYEKRTILDPSPDSANIRRGFDHGLTRFAGKSFREVRHVDHNSIDAVARRRMRIGHGAQAHVFRTLVGAVPLGESDEEALFGREAVDGLKVLVFVGILPRY